MSSERFTMSRVFIAILVILSCQSVYSQLQYKFYRPTCRFAELIVREEVKKAFNKDKGVAAGLVRMHFHDCFVRGCEGSVMLDSMSTNKAEKDSPVNFPSLRGFEVIDNAKARLEDKCRGVVSCADILAFAARDSIKFTKGLEYDVRGGRRDGRVSLAAETFTNLPPPFFNVDQLTLFFIAKGFTQQEMVTLSGAHTIGRSHCSSFSNRLYSFNATTRQDPSLDPDYVEELKQQCPPGNPNSVVFMNPSSPAVTDIRYYIDLLAKRGLFTSDQTLTTNADTLREVNQNAMNNRLWLKKFAAAMIKMSELGVLTGRAGEIRRNCRVVN